MHWLLKIFGTSAEALILQYLKGDKKKDEEKKIKKTEGTKKDRKGETTSNTREKTADPVKKKEHHHPDASKSGSKISESSKEKNGKQQHGTKNNKAATMSGIPKEKPSSADASSGCDEEVEHLGASSLVDAEFFNKFDDDFDDADLA
eukprot:TRINITY_DN2340_c0_g1_i1.p1 TRINITY_DN2340_c0_g1~~TRINITY_DN2340_c0_g1_i1.p1  ORF type:complete len:147 (-),score=41.71 TRINITY_DN2340_c0_g1_i1:395-835(-)